MYACLAVLAYIASGILIFCFNTYLVCLNGYRIAPSADHSTASVTQQSFLGERLSSFPNLAFVQTTLKLLEPVSGNDSLRTTPSDAVAPLKKPSNYLRCYSLDIASCHDLKRRMIADPLIRPAGFLYNTGEKPSSYLRCSLDIGFCHDLLEARDGMRAQLAAAATISIRHGLAWEKPQVPNFLHQCRRPYSSETVLRLLPRSILTF